MLVKRHNFAIERCIGVVVALYYCDPGRQKPAISAVVLFVPYCDRPARQHRQRCPTLAVRPLPLLLLLLQSISIASVHRRITDRL